MQGSKREKFSTEDDDRRRSPRFSCGGQARIVCLPSDGILLAAKIRNLSLGGCGIQTVSPLECGTRAEILLRVNGSFFRAIGQVRAARCPSGIGMEFIGLSAGGQDMLVELIRELARRHAIASMLRAARREPDPKQWNGYRAALLNGNPPIIGSGVDSQNGEANALVVDRGSLILDGELDLFI
jgi:hypothetical protein